MTNSVQKTAVVTGAGQGIGLGIARALAVSGFRVALVDWVRETSQREADRLESDGHDVFAWRLDVADPDAWLSLRAEVQTRFGGLDALVNNAGISPRSTVETTDDALWERTLGTNLKGPWLGIKTFLPMLRNRRGRIINIGSTHATLPRRNMFVYGVSKAGLLGLTRQVAIEYLHEGITCNMIAPGWVPSPGEQEIQKAEGRPGFPKGVLCVSSPEDVGRAALYLLSDAARNVTGEVIHLDGGLHAFGDTRWVHRGEAP